jgi:hypothetical protein
MPTLPVPIFSKVYKSVDGVELSDQNLTLCDGYLDELGGTVARPGTSALWSISTATGSGWDGLYFWYEKNMLVGVADGFIYRITYPGKVANFEIVDTVPIPALASRATFTTDGTYVFIAYGGKIYYITDISALNALPAYTGSQNATHVRYLDGYILANDSLTNRFLWSDVNTPLTWNALNFAASSGASDTTIAVEVVNREIYLFGARSVEIWENDGSSPFARIPGGFIQSGCSAPYSIVVDDSALYWLDDKRHFVKYNGKNVEKLATPYDRVIQGFDTVADCFVQKLEIDSRPFFVFQFPTANKTIVYNASAQDWCEWGKWDPERSEYDQWICGAYCYAEPWGLHLIGRRDKVVISEMSQDYTDDDGDVIRLCRVTGNINFGTTKTKRTNEFRIVVRRGSGLSTRTPQIMIRYKEDGLKWSQLKTFSLGDLGEYRIVLRDLRRNIFRTKQYEFTATDSVPLVFINAEEDLEVLR